MILPNPLFYFMTCKGGCTKYKAKKPCNNDVGRYEIGQKRCSTCEIFIEWKGLWCPCCRRLLRTKPRNTPNRHRLQEVNFVKRL